MRIQPRQELLDAWEAIAHASVDNDEWVWGGRHRCNSISDAEQLLCLLAPATSITNFALDRPDQTADDVLTALHALGDSVEIPQRLIRVVTEYMQKYTDGDGTPTFAGNGYFEPTDQAVAPSTNQQRLDVVQSFATSITLSLATIAFIRVFRSVVRRENLRQHIDRLEAMASQRLSAAMVGLLRSFVVNVFDADSASGWALCRTADQVGMQRRRVVEDLRRALQEVTAALRELTIGSGRVLDLDNPNRLFECGWSWGIVKDAPPVEITDKIGRQAKGIAQHVPNLHFTLVALDAIQDLFSERTRILGILNGEQLRLAQALQLRWDLTQRYWSTIATFGSGRWPLEDVPWRTSDEVESDYFTLVISSMVVSTLRRVRASDADLARIGNVLAELASRSRITRRPFVNDPGIALHSPGVRLDLVGSEDAGDPRLGWMASGFAPLLLRATLRVTGEMRDTDARGRFRELADEVWDHIRRRRFLDDPGRGLWDQPALVFSDIKMRHDLPSWSFTERVIECLVVAAQVARSQPLPSARLAEVAMDLLGEAEHLFDQELLSGSSDAGPSMRTVLQAIRARLWRAREIVDDRPGTAAVLATEALRELDQLAAARLDARGEY